MELDIEVRSSVKEQDQRRKTSERIVRVRGRIQKVEFPQEKVLPKSSNYKQEYCQNSGAEANPRLLWQGDLKRS